jgi:hypothetical protein
VATCDATSIASWCAGIGIQDCACVAAAYCASHNGQLPTDLVSFVAWGDSTGYRNPTTLVWHCPLSGGGGTCTPACAVGQVCSNGVCVAAGGGTSGQVCIAGVCVPSLVAYGGAGLLALMLLRRK